MKLSKFKRLVAEDFPTEVREVINKIAFSYNSSMEQIDTALSGNLDFDNLNQAKVSFKVKVDASGVPVEKVQLISPLKSSIKGAICIDIQNLTDTSLLTSAPYVAFTRNSGVLTITQVLGLQVNKEYNVTVILIG